MKKPFKSIKWKNITVSGQAASGSTTLAKNLAEKLGWKLINGGEIVRKYVKEKGIPLEKTTSTPDNFHIDLDDFIKRKLKNEKELIIESWLSGFDAQNIPQIFKILVICSSEKERIKRVSDRDNKTLKEAKKHIQTREKENVKKWKKLYKTKDFWNQKYYNFIIDTNKNKSWQTLKKVLAAVGYKTNSSTRSKRAGSK